MGEPPPNLLTTDPPEHTALRRVTASRFRPALVRKLQPAIEATTTEIMNDIVERETCDFISDVAAILPMATICSLFGIPRSDWDRVFEMQNRAVGSNDPDFVPDLLEQGSGAQQLAAQRSAEAQLEMAMYFAELAASKGRSGFPDDDLISILAQEGLAAEIFLTYCFVLVVAGNETTRQSLAGGTSGLIEFGGEYQRLHENRDLLESGVEEMIRWATPVIHFMRVATKDVEIRGQRVRAGDKLALWYLSGNRDEAEFSSPFTFDIARTPNDHVGFGFGEHFCLGAHLARLQMKVFFTQLLDRVASIEYVAQPDRMRANFINGFKRMEVKLHPR
jgi:cytochrome P450